MQRSARSRGLGHGGLGHQILGRGGACLAFASSILVLTALPSPAAAHEDRQATQDRQATLGRPAPQPGNGRFTVQLTPGEVPTGGDRGGRGVARLELDEAHETACYVIEWKGLDGEVTAAHLHAGPRGQANGPHAIDFFNDQHFAGGQDSTSGCVTSARDKIRDIIEHPAGYYVNIHTTAYKPGAIRGQLSDSPRSS